MDYLINLLEGECSDGRVIGRKPHAVTAIHLSVSAIRINERVDA